MNHEPPRLAERILSALLPANVREEALDDLADLHRERLTLGRTGADRWYWRQVPGFVLRIRLAAAVAGSLDLSTPTHPAPPREKPMSAFLSDLRRAARGTVRNPAFTAIAVLTLALGIGANAAIFSVIRSVLLRPLPFPEPERIVTLWETRPDRDMFQISFTYANFWDVLEQNRTLSAVGAIRWNAMNMTGDAEPVRLSVASATVGFFRALGVKPVMGRLFVDGEDATGSDTHLAVLSHAFWNSRFGGDSAITQRSLRLNNESYRVIGVLPPGTPWLDAADVFIPFTRPAVLDRDSWELPVIGRLAPGVTLAAARADLDIIAKRLAGQYPEAKGMGISVRTTEEWVAGDNLRRALWVLVGAVGFLLAIACVNLANMLLARATSRARERAMRAALGATRGRVVQLALAESLVLGLLGGAAGVALAVGAVKLLSAWSPGDIPRLAQVQIDVPVLLFTFALALGTALLVGMVPALRTPYHDVVTALRDGERSVAGSRGGGRVRRALVTVEVALSLILLVGAGLLLQSFRQVLSVDRGFVTENRLVYEVGFPSGGTREESIRRGQTLVELVRRLRSTPQIQAAGAVHLRPLQGSGTGMGFGAVDRPDATGDQIPWAGWRLVTDGYFRTMGLPLVAGRDFTDQDRIGDPWKVIISQRIAETLWPGESAIGRQMVLWKGQGQSTGEVIGVVGDMRDWSLTDDPTYSVYLPIYGAGMSPANIVVHSSLPAATVTATLRSFLSELDASVPLSRAESLNDLVWESVASRRFTMFLLAALAGTALVLALAGIYGVLSYAVSQRRAEMGVRMALGASARSVLGLVMRQGMRPVVIGLALGIVGALGLSRFLTGLLYGMTASDWPTYAAVATLLAGAAALACYLPAREALRVDVTATLREE
ncbi:MAG TPA: ADOP family duplicated permease [Gemmatimonadaceae bacterium]